MRPLLDDPWLRDQLGKVERAAGPAPMAHWLALEWARLADEMSRLGWAGVARGGG